MNNKISLCMIVKNEERYLQGCLNSVKDIVDEIIVVDTGSEDRTVEIAQSFGASVYFFKWDNNFSEARNESLKHATQDWILIMDGDEEFCLEDVEQFRSLLNGPLVETGIYFFESLSYCGSTIDDNNISININPRLFKNNHGFSYEGKVHNQLVNSKYQIQEIIHPIRIYHYGYLEDIMVSKDKRSRNMPLLEEQLRQNSDNKYAHFNIGNEYYSLNNLPEALEHYYRSYEDFNPYSGYGFILLARIIVTNYNLGEYDKALKFADIGIKYFPNYTDLYYLMSMVYNQCNKPTLEIKALEKCIELGDPPSELKFLYGTGGYKAFYALGNVYMRLKDYDKAYHYFTETIRSKHDYVTPIYNIGHLLKEKNTPIDEFKSIMESFFTDYPKAYQIIADVFYIEGYYDLTLEYVEKYEDSGIFPENLMILKAKALVRTNSFDECIKMNTIDEKSSFYLHFSMYKIISSLLTNNYEYGLSQVKNFKDTDLSEFNKKMLKVYEQLINIYAQEPLSVLSEDENEKEYTSIIIDICEIFLINKKYDEFEKALSLMNLISDKSVLLLLGKLYYKYGYINLAKKEIIRSIKEFEVFDSEGIDILKC